MSRRNKAKLKSARERAVVAEPLGDPPLSPVRLYLSCNAIVYRRYPYIGGFSLFVYFQYRKVSVLLLKVYFYLQKAEVTNLGFLGGDNRTRKEHKVRRNSGKPSSDLRAEFTQDGGPRQR